MRYKKGLTWQYLTLVTLCMLLQWRRQNAKSYAHQRGNTRSSSDSLKLRPFSK